MPLYESECPQCGLKQENYVVLPTAANFPCKRCGTVTERLFSRFSGRVFQQFWTRNIDPEGKPILIETQSQLSHLCNEHKLTHIDDPKAEFKPYKPKPVEEIIGDRIIPVSEDAGGACRKDELL